MNVVEWLTCSVAAIVCLVFIVTLLWLTRRRKWEGAPDSHPARLREQRQSILDRRSQR